MVVTIINRETECPNIEFESPNGLTQGTYLAKSKNEVLLQLPKLKTKNGVVKNKNNEYMDLLIDENTKYLNDFFLNIQEISKQEIKKKQNLWFTNTLTDDDINYYFNDTVKRNVMRVTVENNLYVFNKDGEPQMSSSIKGKEIICIISFNGLKFTNTSFILEFNVRQVMVLESEYEKCLVNNSSENLEKKNKINLEDNSQTTNSDKLKHLENEESENREMINIEPNNRVQDNRVQDNRVQDNRVQDNQVQDNRVQDNRVQDNQVQDNRVQDNRVQDNQVQDNQVQDNQVQDNRVQDNQVQDNQAQNNEEQENEEQENEEQENKEQENKEQENKEQQNEEQENEENEIIENDNSDDELSDISSDEDTDLSEIDINENLESEDLIQLKKPHEIYKNMYKETYDRACAAKQYAIKTFLEAKQIKQLHLLNDLESSEEEDLNF